jgi:hypothetical protein
MSKNRGVVYVKPGVVEVRDIADPKFEDPQGRNINHAVGGARDLTSETPQCGHLHRLNRVGHTPPFEQNGVIHGVG